MVRVLEHDLEGYRVWTAGNPDGYILNIRGGKKAAMLHRTPCKHVFPAREEYGDFTRTRKVCAGSRDEVESWAKNHGLAFVMCKSCDK